MISTITDQHRQRPACVYVRQSTLSQVRHNPESTDRQYALRDKAMELGWQPERIHVLDADLGVSGAQTTGREDFKTLVAEVSMGRVGAIFALEASRLARSSLDWHRLIELCALTETLVFDEDGGYDPADFNDALLLGLKATLAQAELHAIRSRLQGGKLNKAQRGALRFPLPVGFVYDDDDQIVLDPDQEVQGAVRLIFRFFRETGSAYGVMARFRQLALLFPKRAYGGAWNAKLIWGPLSHGRVLGVLKNPSYTGTYVYGRYQSRKQIGPQGQVSTRTTAMPIEQWRVRIADHHPGYLTWDEFEDNQRRLRENQTNGDGTILSTAAREGLALLQGVLYCSRCGRRLTVRYRGNGGIYPIYECNWRRREGLATRACMTFGCDPLDRAVEARLLAVMTREQIELALAAMHELEQRRTIVSRQWQMRVERAQYEADLAERRYEQVDPCNRLVAATLEQRWNDALARLEEIKRQQADFEHTQRHPSGSQESARLLDLAQDFARLWFAPSTKNKDKKRMLRVLIRDITVERRDEPRVAVLHIRWQGGICEDLEVPLPLPVADRVRYPVEVVERVRQLAQTRCDAEIAQLFNEQGRRSTKGNPFTTAMIRWIRYKHRIPAPCDRQPGELTGAEVAKRFGVSSGVVYYWIERSLIDARRLHPGGPYAITLDANKEVELKERVSNSSRIQRQRQSVDSQSVQ